MSRKTRFTLAGAAAVGLMITAAGAATAAGADEGRTVSQQVSARPETEPSRSAPIPAATRPAYLAAKPANLSTQQDARNNQKYYNNDGSVYVTWDDGYHVNGNWRDRDDIILHDDEQDDHGIWVRVEHPTGQFLDSWTGSLGSSQLSLPNLRDTWGLGLTVCSADENGDPIDGTCAGPYWVVE